MARPTKQGVDYFPLDVRFDNEIELYILETEAEGLAVLITLWQLIYSNEGYYIKYDEDLPLLIKKRINVNINSINEYINVAIKRKIFDKNLFEKYKILTSRGIQRRYFEASKRKKSIVLISEFLLKGVNVSKNAVIVSINEVNANGNATKEEEEEKEEEKEEVNVKEVNVEEDENKTDSAGKNLVDIDIFGEKISPTPNYTDYEKIWNEFAKQYKLPQIRDLTEKRKRKLKKRLKEKNFNLIEILKQAEKQPFLLGENKSGWTVTFDWIIENSNNYIKILEEHYADKNKQREFNDFEQLFNKIANDPRLAD